MPLSTFSRIKDLFDTSSNSPFLDLFWRRSAAIKASKILCEEVDEIIKDAQAYGLAGYRGYVVDTEGQEVLLKTPLYVEYDSCERFAFEYVAAISPERVDPNSLLVVVEPVIYGRAEKSDADIIDDATLDLPKRNVLKNLQVTAMVDILDILREHGVYEATYEQAGASDIDQ